VGLVYSKKYRTAAEYLKEYAQKYRTVEVDSFFYRLPSEKDVSNYKMAVDDDFKFTIKAPQDITLTHTRVKEKGAALEPNTNFLSADFFSGFLERIAPLSKNITAIMLEFEYLRKEKMGSMDLFCKALETFIQQIPRAIPIAVETRNSNYLGEEYFSFLKEKELIHVFSEKQFLPPVTSLFQKYSSYLTDTVIIRLLGGDRAAIEEMTGENWVKIVDEKKEKLLIVEMIKELLTQKKRVTLNVNNHYEGCAPLTIAEMEKFFNI
jgi:uncharacterized protein YecE (DUF72 family)